MSYENPSTVFIALLLTVGLSGLFAVIMARKGELK